MVRHPQYTGIFLALFGQIIHWPTIPTVVLFPVIVGAYVHLARKEETELVKRFGAEYVRYQRRVPRFFPRPGKWGRLFGGGRAAAAGTPAAERPDEGSSLEREFEPFRRDIVGYDQTFESPYGERRIIYADWTASGRLYRPIEDRIVEAFGPFVGNTHSESSRAAANDGCHRRHGATRRGMGERLRLFARYQRVQARQRQWRRGGPCAELVFSLDAFRGASMTALVVLARDD